VNFDVGVELYNETLVAGSHYEVWMYQYPCDIEISNNTQTSIQTLKFVSMDPLPPGAVLKIVVSTTETTTHNIITHVKGIYNEISEERFTISNPLGSLSAPLSISGSDSDMGIWGLDYKGSIH
jgi:hypothetical protein